MLDKMKQMYELNRKAQQLKAELENTDIEVKAADGNSKIVIRGDLKVKSLELREDLVCNKESLQNEVVKLVNDAVRKAQELAAKKTSEITGFNLPGM